MRDPDTIENAIVHSAVSTGLNGFVMVVQKSKFPTVGVVTN